MFVLERAAGKQRFAGRGGGRLVCRVSGLVYAKRMSVAGIYFWFFSSFFSFLVSLGCFFLDLLIMLIVELYVCTYFFSCVSFLLSSFFLFSFLCWLWFLLFLFSFLCVYFFIFGDVCFIPLASHHC